MVIGKATPMGPYRHAPMDMSRYAPRTQVVTVDINAEVLAAVRKEKFQELLKTPLAQRIGSMPIGTAYAIAMDDSLKRLVSNGDAAQVVALLERYGVDGVSVAEVEAAFMDKQLKMEIGNAIRALRTFIKQWR